MKKICLFLCLLWMGFIFFMSSNIGKISHAESTKLANLITMNKYKVETLKSGPNQKPVEQINKLNKSLINGQKIKTQNLNRLDHYIRKNAHAFEYILLAIVVSGTLFAFDRRGKGTIIYILFICLFYAVTDEYHQSFVPGRTSLVSDVLIDFGGALIGLSLFYLLYYKVYQKYKFIKDQN